MATIRTALQIQDGMTPAFRSITNALNITISSFESMQRASGRAMNTSNISAARAELSKAELALNGVEQNIRDASAAQQQLNGQMRQGKDAAGGLAGKVKEIALGLAAAVGLISIIALSDTVAQTTARLDLMNDGLQTTEQLQQLIFESAQRSRGAYQTTADAVSKLGMQAKDAFSSTAEIVAFAEQLNKTFVIAGTSTIGVESAMLQLTQAMAAGKLQGEELNAILDNAQPIVANIAKYLGVPVGHIKQMASDGLITSNIIKNAMFAAADETNRKFESMPKTFGQIWTAIKNQALKAFQPILQQLNAVANSKGFEAIVNGIIGALVVLAGIAEKVFNEVAYMAGLISDNWSFIEPVIWAVVAAYLAYNAVSLITNGIIAAQSIITGIKATMTAAAAGATFMATVAQHGLNAALYACPITWIIAAIIALIAIFYLVIAAMNKWAGTSLSATGIIVGAMYVAGAIIGNIFIALHNTAVDVFSLIWNYIASFAEFFANVFNDPVGSIVRLFANMADTVLSILSTIAKAIDTLFGSKLSAAVEGWRNTLKGAVTANFGDAAIKVQRADPNALRLERIDYGQAWQSGYKMGEGIGNFNISKLGKTGTPGIGSGIDLSQFGNAASDLAETADNTGKIKDSIDITEEDLKYLRDIAEQEVINRFTTAEIKIDMKNDNYINNNMDIDGVVSHLETKLAESMQIAAEGVHK